MPGTQLSPWMFVVGATSSTSWVNSSACSSPLAAVTASGNNADVTLVPYPSNHGRDFLQVHMRKRDLLDMDDGRFIHYSLSLPPGRDCQQLLAQLSLSLCTLRRTNPRVAVVLFLYGAMPPELARICHGHSVMVHPQGSYEQRLAELSPQGWPVLARYPVLHKFLNFAAFSGTGARQLLYCDCDTIFFKDVSALFERYADADLVAREEVHTTRSRYGENREFLDEPLLRRVAEAANVAAIPPFNSGVVLLNNNIWSDFARLERVYLDFAWRLLISLSLRPAAAQRYGPLEGIESVLRRASARELADVLPFPSANPWILEEIALWLTLGAVPGLRTRDFHPGDVAQNGEFAASGHHRPDWALCHYYAGNQERVAAWLNFPQLLHEKTR